MKPSRRNFLQTSAGVAAAGLASSTWAQNKAVASERVRVGIMGAGGRALSLINTFAHNKSVEIVAIADIDPKRLEQGVATAKEIQGRDVRSAHLRLVKQGLSDAHFDAVAGHLQATLQEL